MGASGHAGLIVGAHHIMSLSDFIKPCRKMPFSEMKLRKSLKGLLPDVGLLTSSISSLLWDSNRDDAQVAVFAADGDERDVRSLRCQC